MTCSVLIHQDGAVRQCGAPVTGSRVDGFGREWPACDDHADDMGRLYDDARQERMAEEAYAELVSMTEAERLIRAVNVEDFS